MPDHDATLPQNLRPPPHESRRGSQERYTGGTSTGTRDSIVSGSLMSSAFATDTSTWAQRLSNGDPFKPDRAHNGHGGHGFKETMRNHRSHRPRSRGAFFISDAFEDAAPDTSRAHGHRTRRTVTPGNKGKNISTGYTEERPYRNGPSGLGLGLTPDADISFANGSAERPHGTPPDGLGNKHMQHFQTSPGMTSSTSSADSLDMESTQIVNMALNLSESRRMVQSRNVTQPLPPRLVPFPTDNSVAGGLRQQLQQQRRASRGLSPAISPKPERANTQRLTPGVRVTSSLQSPFEPMLQEGSFKYHFTASTLARAQKAKDYMELLAQYRRVIDLLPPLKPNTLSKASTLSDHSTPLAPTPINFNIPELSSKLGRPYDPLQYIRNRKVRARERKTIDGEAQGFGDVVKVSDWVDEVAKWVATRQIRTPGSAELPPFAGADVNEIETSPPSQASRPSMSIARPKRPRNDWVIDPSDMIADVYWLEKDDHKRLVEDRNWRRIFPQDLELYRPLSRATDDASPAPAPATATATASTAQAINVDAEDFTADNSLSDPKATKPDHDHAFSTARERARQKLQDLTGFHHRRSGSFHGHGHEFHRRKGSVSDSSDSDSHKMRSRRDTFGSNSKDILEKQMLEMIAREAREDASRGQTNPDAQEPKIPLQSIMTPEHIGVMKQRTGPSHSESRTEISELDDKKGPMRSRTGSPQRPGRPSLDVPSFSRRMSIGSESSAPNSPDFRPSRHDNYFIPGIGMDLSPSSSRHGSPSRNPFSKVKHMFRDRSRDRTAERVPEILLSEKEDDSETPLEIVKRVSGSPDVAQQDKTHGSRVASLSPDRKIVSQRTGDSHRSHRKHDTARVGDAGAGLRSLFKAPRIDTVLKSGVAKVSELFWRKESAVQDSDSSSSSSDDSDSEQRGRHNKAGSKQFLDVVPPFLSASDGRGPGDISRRGSISVPLSRPTSRRSTRFELMRPPRIDIQNASPPSPTIQKVPEIEISSSDSRPDSVAKGIKDADNRLNAVLSAPPPRGRFSMETGRGSRWPISEYGLLPEGAPISKREIARLRAYMLSSGIVAREISQRINQPALLDSTNVTSRNDVMTALGDRISWAEITQLTPEDQRRELANRPISQKDLFPVTADILGSSIELSSQHWHSAAEDFKNRTKTDLQQQIDNLRNRLALDLTSMTRGAADEADDASRDLVVGQRLKVKLVMDVMDKMLRRRRRRFRWVRRAGWLAVEWLLVGFMWYVWFVVMIARIFLGIGKGVVRSVRWLLWL